MKTITVLLVTLAAFTLTGCKSNHTPSEDCTSNIFAACHDYN